MGTVAREGAITLLMPSNDHPPPHVHVLKRGVWHVRVALVGPKALDVRDGLVGPSEWRLIEALVAKHLWACWQEWRRIHGPE